MYMKYTLYSIKIDYENEYFGHYFMTIIILAYDHSCTGLSSLQNDTVFYSRVWENLTYAILKHDHRVATKAKDDIEIEAREREKDRLANKHIHLIKFFEAAEANNVDQWIYKDMWYVVCIDCDTCVVRCFWMHTNYKCL